MTTPINKGERTHLACTFWHLAKRTKSKRERSEPRALLTIALSTLLLSCQAKEPTTGLTFPTPETSAQATHPNLAHATHLPQDQIEPFLNEYCVKCHGPDKQKGQIRLDQAPWLITDNDSAQRWQDVLDQINGGDMPPEDEDQPNHQELTALLGTLTTHLHTASQRLNSSGGEIKMRRLNRREYASTIHQLFGFDLKPHHIPEDGEIETFDTVGEEQFFTSAHFEKYLTLGKKIATQALSTNTAPYKKPKTFRVQPEKSITAKLRKKVAAYDKQRAIKDAGGDWKEMGFKDEGDAKILFRQWDSRVEKPRRYLEYPLVGTGVYLCGTTRSASINRNDSDLRAHYNLRLHGGIHNGGGITDDLRRIIRIRDNNSIIATRKIYGTPQKPITIEIQTRLNLGDHRLSFKLEENVPKNSRTYLKNTTEPTDKIDPQASIWLDWIELDGPFYPEKRPLFEDLLYPNTPTGKDSPYLGKDDQTRELIAKFAYQAFRRKPPTNTFLDALHNHYTEQRAKGLKYKEALSEVLAIVLASPGFLFIQEDAPAQTNPHPKLTPRELAVRLSYFLWSSPPDPELYAAPLDDPAIYSQQIDRLLADPRAQAFRDGFIQQWAEFDRYDAITIDPKEYYRFNEGLQQDAKQEVREFFGTLLKENLPIQNLIDSNFVTINGALANHYELPFNKKDNTPGREFRKVPLPASSPRGGLLTQAAFLITGSNGERSSPVIRGALVMEKLLHDKPAPPPPNVPELGSNDNKPRSNRELVLLHQSQAVCASCHTKMDAIGFGLENFDPIGRWRDNEQVGKKLLAIQPGGTLPGGHEFANIQELKSLLLNEKDHLAEELVESFLAYALGRRIEFSDQSQVQAILQKTKAKNYRTRDLLKEVALSPLFHQK